MAHRKDKCGIIIDMLTNNHRVLLPYEALYFFFKSLFIYDSHTQREREAETQAETQAEGEAGPMHWEPNVGLHPGSPGSRPGPKAGAKPLRHPGIPITIFF